ncbi:MAG: translocation/assembly module TamB domain-containing protein [Magnetococcales bacterium]|nr:translocation/assembly module TamB domain-containing protein [Magnetococcales bacterium]
MSSDETTPAPPPPDEPTSRAKPLRWLARLFVVVIVVLLIPFTILQTDWGRQQLVDVVETLLGEMGINAQIRGLDGFIPFSIELEHLALADQDGDWFALDQLRIAWSPLGPPLGIIRVQEISAEKITLLRPPLLPPSEAPPEVEELQAGPMVLPQGLPPFEIDRLAVARLELGEAILGSAATFNLNGRMGIDQSGEMFDLQLKTERLDQATAHLNITAGLNLATGHLTLNTAAQERGGLVAMLSGLQEAGDLSLELDGEGPLDDWQGKLAAGVEGLGEIHTGLTLTLGEPLGITLDGSLSMVQDPLMLGVSPWTFKTQATRSSEGVLSLKTLDLALPLGTLQAQATLDEATNQLQAQATIALPDLDRLSPIAATPLAGGVNIILNADGPLPHPTATIDITGQAIDAPQVAIDQLTATLNARWSQEPQNDQPTLLLTGKGGVSGLQPADQPAWPEKELQWQLKGRMPPDGRLHIAGFDLTGQTLALGLKGDIDPAAPAAQVELTTRITDPTPWAEPQGLAIDGRLALTTRIDFQENPRRIRVDLDGGLDDFQGIPEAAALLGPHMQLTGKVLMTGEEAIQLKGLSLKGRAIHLTASSIDFNTATQALMGQIDLTLPDLNPLSNALGKPLAGQVTTTAKLSGSATEPTLDLTVKGSSIRFDQEKIERLALKLATTGSVASPTGNIHLTATRQKQHFSVATPFEKTAAGVNLKDLRIDFPGGQITGPLDIDLAGPLLTGTLTGKIHDPAAMIPPPGMNLAGHIVFKAQLHPGGKPGGPLTRQDLDFELDGADIKGDFGSLAWSRLEARVTDLLAEIGFKATLNATQFETGDMVVQETTLQTDGDLKGLNLTLTTEGRAVEIFTARTQARVDLLDNGVAASLNTLDGTFGPEPFHLAHPLHLKQSGREMTLEALDLTFGTAQLTGAGTLTEQGVTAKIDLDLPLSLASQFGAPPLTGKAALQGNLSGHPSKPRAEVHLNVSDFHMDEPALKPVPPADLTLHLALGDDQAKGELLIEKLTVKPAKGHFALPVTVSLIPWNLVIPQNEPLSGVFNMEADMARLMAFLAPDGWEMGGQMKADFTATGTLETPQASGELTVGEGFFKSIESGTDIQKMTLVAKLDEKVLVLEKLSATDGNKGQLSGSGKVSFLEKGGYTFGIHSELDHANLVQRDDLSATISGAIDVTGDTSLVMVKGDLTTDRVLFYLPEGVGPDIATLELRESGESADGEEDGTEDSESAAIKLDVAVHIPGQVYVRGKGLESEWRGDLKIKGYATNPVVLGDLSVKKGTFDFLDHRFNLDKGIIEFGGASPPTPNLDISASVTKEEIKAVIGLEGPASEPKLILTSEPPQPQDEILANLLFDRNASDITPGQAIKLAAAVARLQGGGPGMMDKMQDSLGIDSFEAGGDDLATGTVKVGKYIGDRVFLEVEQGLSEGSGKMSVEVELTPDITLETEMDQKQNGAFGINWKHDY